MVGLDQYLLAKIKGKETGNLTGACGGLFPITPKSNKTEIGYWRKHYALDRLIAEIKGFDEDEDGWDDMNCKDIRLTKSQCQKIKDYAICEMQEMEEWYHGDVQKLMDSNDGWDYSQWLKTMTIMDAALKAIEKDRATIYYKYWR